MSASPVSRLNRLRNLRLRRPDFWVSRERKTRVLLLLLCIAVMAFAGFALMARHAQLVGRKGKAISDQVEGRNLVQSTRDLLEYVQYYPRDADANYHLGLLLLPEDAPLAAECFGRAVELGYNDISAYRYLGDALWRLRRKRSAESAYKEFLRRAAHDPKQTTQVSYVKGRLHEITKN